MVELSSLLERRENLRNKRSAGGELQESSMAASEQRVLRRKSSNSLSHLHGAPEFVRAPNHHPSLRRGFLPLTTNPTPEVPKSFLPSIASAAPQFSPTPELSGPDPADKTQTRRIYLQMASTQNGVKMPDLNTPSRTSSKIRAAALPEAHSPRGRKNSLDFQLYSDISAKNVEIQKRRANIMAQNQHTEAMIERMAATG